MRREFKLFFFDKVEMKTPLKEVNFKGKLVNNHLNMEVRQVYENIYDTNCEFIYVFPIPRKAFISSFTARIGDKIIVGKLEEKNKAEKEYEDAKKNGNIASLLSQLGEDVFQISLGNIQKNSEIEISISYLEEIQNIDGTQEISVPCMIARRYSNLEPEFLNKKDRAISGIDYGVTRTVGNYSFELSSLRKFSSIESPTHKIKTQICSDGLTVTAQEENLDRDFTIIISSEEVIENRVEYWKERENTYGIVNFTPEFESENIQESKEYFFLIDISGSMSGKNLFEAKKALKLALKNLEVGDLFNIVAFESSYYPMSRESLAYNQKNLDKAVEYIDSLEAMGGTEILPAIKFTLENRMSREFPLVAMLFTDGQVSNELFIVNYLEENRENIQFYTFGIDENINRSFLENLAEAGNGSAEFVFPGERIDKKILRHFFKISCPYKKNLVSKDNLSIMNLPKKFYNGETYSLYFKTDKPLEKGLSIGFENEKSLDFLEIASVSEEKGKIFKNIYNKGYLITLENKFSTRPTEKLKKEIIDFSLRENILSQETAFIGIYKNENNFFEEYKTISVPSYEEISEVRFMMDMDSMGYNESIDECQEVALKQNADGSFGNSDSLEERIKETIYSIEVLLKSKDKDLYKKQIEKGKKYLLLHGENMDAKNLS